MLTAADRISRMVLDLLDIARSGSGALQLCSAPVQLCALLGEISSWR